MDTDGMTDEFANDHGLWLHEELLLLMLRDEQGTIAPGAMYQQALGGAMLAELMLQGRIGVAGEAKNANAVVTDTAPTGDELLDDCLLMMGASSRERKLRDWVGKFSGVKDLKGRAAARLVEAGVLRREEDRVLLVFPRTRYPEEDHGPEGEIVSRLWKAIFGGGEVDDARTAVLISLAHSANLLGLVFDRRELKRRRPRIEAIVNGDLVGRATREAIQAVQAAIVAACTAAVVVTTASG